MQTFVEEVMLHSIRLMASTAALVFFLTAAVYLHWQWLSLIVPGAILVWVGLVMPTPRPRIGIQKNIRGGLN
jgi:hypothetical protein